MVNMANKLRDLFQNEQEQYSFTIKSEKKEEIDKIVNAIKKMQKDGQAQTVETNAELIEKVIQGRNEYTIGKYKDLQAMTVSPLMDIIQVPIMVRGKEESIALTKKYLDKRLIIETADNKAISLKFDIDLEKKTIQLKYEPHLENASSFTELLFEYDVVESFVSGLFRNDVAIPEKERLISMVSRSHSFVERLMKVLTILDIEMTPNEISDNNDDTLLVEQLYILLVEHKTIRKNDKLNHIDGVLLFDKGEGETIFATYIDTFEVSVFGHKRNIYTVNCVFNAVVNGVEKNKEGKQKILFTDSDSRPMFLAYSGFINRKEAEKEQEIIINNISDYENAKRFGEHLSALIELTNK